MPRFSSRYARASSRICAAAISRASSCLGLRASIRSRSSRVQKVCFGLASTLPFISWWRSLCVRSSSCICCAILDRPSSGSPRASKSKARSSAVLKLMAGESSILWVMASVWLFQSRAKSRKFLSNFSCASSGSCLFSAICFCCSRGQKVLLGRAPTRSVMAPLSALYCCSKPLTNFVICAAASCGSLRACNKLSTSSFGLTVMFGRWETLAEMLSFCVL
mmetsp:Transcript_68473/g.222844  ORF Transcript_68473/g.222844 Transcript_68473/m.222844 type:complete len:220 (+) Transcript_68473:200-859(+)